MEWLVGSWVFNSEEGIIFENWQMNGDTLLQGESGYLDGQDTIVFERVLLAKRGEDIYYMVYGQNETQPTLFKLTSNDNNTLVFENPQHDFPTKITYALITPDSIVAEISGQSKGVSKRQQFLYARGR